MNDITDKVKIGEFLRRGYKITGIVHVGAHDGYEMEWYLKLGIEHLIGVEPLPRAFSDLMLKFGEMENVKLYRYALGKSKRETADLKVASGDGKSSTLLELAPDYMNQFPDISFLRKIKVPATTWMDLVNKENISISSYNCLVLDVEGMELDVLIGMGPYLAQFDLLNIECSGEPTYIGGPTATEIISYLSDKYEPITQIQPHDDVLFVKKGLL